ncbi:MAG: hypothetical protein JJU28_18505 [Cyclobacteriaceae bacterium]|nr:hypothetical protein [Cyclobacteriaceae bacterium]
MPLSAMACIFQSENPSIDYTFFNEHESMAYLRLLDLDFDATRDIKPENPASLYILSLQDFCRIFLSGDKSIYGQIKGNEKYYLEILSEHQKDLAIYQFVYSEIKLHWGLIKMYHGDWLSGFLSIRQAIQYARNNHKQFPDYGPSHKTLGVLHVMLSVLPEKYHWATPVIGLKADMSMGKSLLKGLEQTNSIFSEETGIIQALVMSYLHNDNNWAFEKIKELMDSRPEPMLIMFLASPLALKNQMGMACIQYSQGFMEISNTKGNYIPPIAYYYRAEAFLQRGMYNACINQYQLFLNKHKSEDLHKDAVFKISLAYQLLGNREKAEFYFNRAQLTGKTQTEADKNAAQILQGGNLPDSALMLARLQFDGGYFTEAEKTLSSIPVDVKSENYQLEYHYRMGRIFQAQEKWLEAEKSYKRMLLIPSEKDSYLPANACMQLGDMALMQKDSISARRWYEQAMSYRGHPYSYSISNKAKIKINQISSP